MKNDRRFLTASGHGAAWHKGSFAHTWGQDVQEAHAHKLPEKWMGGKLGAWQSDMSSAPCRKVAQ